MGELNDNWEKTVEGTETRDNGVCRKARNSADLLQNWLVEVHKIINQSTDVLDT